MCLHLQTTPSLGYEMVKMDQETVSEGFQSSPCLGKYYMAIYK